MRSFFSAITSKSFFLFFINLLNIYVTQKYNDDEDELLKGSSSQKTSQAHTKEPQNKKEGKERAITNPNAIDGLRDIQPQSEEPKQRRRPPPQGPQTHPHAMLPTQSCKTAKSKSPIPQEPARPAQSCTGHQNTATDSSPTPNCHGK